MSWSIQTAPAEISQINGWRDPETGYSYLTLKVKGGRITISNDLFSGDIERVHDVLHAMRVVWDAIDPAKGGQERYEIEWPPKAAEQDGEAE